MFKGCISSCLCAGSIHPFSSFFICWLPGGWSLFQLPWSKRQDTLGTGRSESQPTALPFHQLAPPTVCLCFIFSQHCFKWFFNVWTAMSQAESPIPDRSYRDVFTYHWLISRRSFHCSVGSSSHCLTLLEKKQPLPLDCCWCPYAQVHELPTAEAKTLFTILHLNSFFKEQTFICTRCTQT